MTAIPSIDTDHPRVWIGCLACYNNGSLVGEWYDAEDADEVTPEDIHHKPIDREQHEELWVMDTDGTLTNEEMSLAEAMRQAECLMSVPEHDRAALRAWYQSGAYVADCDDLPDTSTFEERYRGQWSSFDEYAYEFVTDTGMLDEIPEDVAKYFDYVAFARDLKFDYTVLDAEIGCFIFADY